MQDPTNQCPKCQAEIRLEDLKCRACEQVIRTQPMLGEILIDEKIISREQLEAALKQQKRRLGEILVEMGSCKAEDLERAMHIQTQGRTRAEMYAVDLKRAWSIGAVMALALGLLAVGLFRSVSKSIYLDRVAREQLTLAEVAAIMADPESPYKFEALKSASRGLNDEPAVGLVKQAMKANKWYVRLYAAMLAKESRKSWFVPSLIALLDDPKEEVVTVAHQALKHITDQSMEPTAALWKEWAEKTGGPVQGPASAGRK